MRLRHIAAVLSFVLALPVTSFAHDNGKPDAWVRIRGGEESVTMSGAMTDVERARSLQSCSEESMLFIRRNGDEWVIRDERVLARIEEGFAAVKKLEAKMHRVQVAHEALQARINTLAARVGEVGAQVGALGAELGQLAHDDPARAGVEARMRKLEAELRKAERPMRALLDATEPFRTEMTRLSTQVQRLIPEAEQRMGEILDEAIELGLAEHHHEQGSL